MLLVTGPCAGSSDIFLGYGLDTKNAGMPSASIEALEWARQAPRQVEARLSCCDHNSCKKPKLACQAEPKKDAEKGKAFRDASASVLGLGTVGSGACCCVFMCLENAHHDFSPVQVSLAPS